MVLNELIRLIRFDTIVDSIECAVEHDCAKERSGRCAVCELGFRFICREPMRLSCGHCICTKCKIGDRVTCKKHGNVTVGSEDLANKCVVKMKLKELFETMRLDFEKTIKLSEDNQIECSMKVENAASYVKETIDVRVESLKNEIDRMRDKLFEKVDENASEIIKKFNFEEHINEARDNLSGLNAYLKSNEKLDMDKLYEYQDELKKSIDEMQAYYDTKFELTFKAEDFAFVGEDQLGTVDSHQETRKPPTNWHLSDSPSYKSGIDLHKYRCNLKIKCDQVIGIHYLGDDLLAQREASKINIWSVRDGSLVQTIDCSSGKFLYVPERKQFAVSPSSGRNFYVWSVQSMNCQKVRSTGVITAFALLEDGSLACGEMVKLHEGDFGVSISVWKFGESLQWASKIENAHAAKIGCLETLPGNRLASGSDDKTIRVWKTDGELQMTLEGHEGQVRCLKLLSEKLLASASENSRFMIWDLDGGYCVKRVNGIGSSVVDNCIAVVPGGFFLVLLSNYLRAFKMSSLEQVHGLPANLIARKMSAGIEVVGASRFAAADADCVNIFDFRGDEQGLTAIFKSHVNMLISLVKSV